MKPPQVFKPQTSPWPSDCSRDQDQSHARRGGPSHFPGWQEAQESQMKQTIIPVMIVLLSMGSPGVRAESGNPFGFETMTHPLEYEYCEKAELKIGKSHYLYLCNSAPRMHPDIERIYLHFVEDVGLCYISSFSFETSPQGELHGLIDRFKEQLAHKYGPPTSKLEEVNAEYPSLSKKYRYDWDKEEGFNGFGDIETIWVEQYRQRAKIFFGMQKEGCNKKINEHRSRAF